MSDQELEEFICTRPSSFDIHAAISERDRRARLRADQVGGSRHNQILRWTIIGAIAATIAAVAAVCALFR